MSWAKAVCDTNNIAHTRPAAFRKMDRLRLFCSKCGIVFMCARVFLWDLKHQAHTQDTSEGFQLEPVEQIKEPTVHPVSDIRPDAEDYKTKESEDGVGNSVKGA